MRQGLLFRPRRSAGGRGRHAAAGHCRAGIVRLLAVAGQAVPHGRDRMDHPAHFVAAHKRRGCQRVCQNEIGRPARRERCRRVIVFIGLSQLHSVSALTPGYLRNFLSFSLLL